MYAKVYFRKRSLFSFCVFIVCRLVVKMELWNCLRWMKTKYSLREIWIGKKVRLWSYLKLSDECHDLLLYLKKKKTEHLITCSIGRIISLSWHPSGSKIAAGMMDMIHIFNVETGKWRHSSRMYYCSQLSRVSSRTGKYYCNQVFNMFSRPLYTQDAGWQRGRDIPQ